MLRITVELVPFGIENNARVIGTGYIKNDGTGTPDIGNYDVVFGIDNIYVPGYVKGFDRRKNAWRLILQALQEIQDFGALDDDEPTW